MKAPCAHCGQGERPAGLARRSKQSPGRAFQSSGFLGVAVSGLLGFLPLVKFGNQDTAYDAYRIPQRCDMPAAAPEPPAVE